MKIEIKKRKKVFIAVLFFFLFLASFPLFSDAAGIVPCGRNSGTAEEMAPCTLCHLIIGIKKIIDFGSTILVIVAVVVIVAAGIMYVISAGSDQQMEKAKNLLKQALTGFTVVLGAWLIINTAMLVLSVNYANLGITTAGWSDFACSTAPISTTLPPAPPPPPGACTGTEAACCKPSTNCVACSGCVAFSNSYPNLCYQSGTNSCQLNSTLASKIQSANLESSGMQVSEAWPPTVPHSNPCHSIGTCADIRCMDQCISETPANIKIKYEALRNAGLNVLFETTSGNCGPYTALGINCSSPSTMTNPSFHVSS